MKGPLRVNDEVGPIVPAVAASMQYMEPEIKVVEQFPSGELL
jgi:hypothetical protein